MPVQGNPFYDYHPIVDRPPLSWPDGKRLAVYVGLNVEYYAFGEGSVGVFDAVASRPVDPINASWRDYGARVGVWRIAELLGRLGVTPSVLLNSDVCEAYPQIIEAGRKAQWCWVAHGKNNSMFAGPAAPSLNFEAERRYLGDIYDTIEGATGQRPKGWLGPLGLSQTDNTTRLLGEQGASYVLDWACDDQPFRLHEDKGGLIAVPYSFEINDLPLFLRTGCDGEAFAQAIRHACDQLLADAESAARVLPICIHPFVVGQPARFKPFADALAAITGRDDIWLTTSDEIAAVFAAQEQRPPSEPDMLSRG